MNTLNDYEKEQLAAILAWKAERPGILRRAFGIVAMPFEWFVQLIVPEAAMRGALDVASELGQRMTDTTDVLRCAKVTDMAALRGKDLRLSDELANSVHDWAVGVAVAEGAAAGTLGILSAPIDIPATITLALRTIHKIGVCYGYECQTDADRQLARGILTAVGALTLEEKAAALAGLTALRFTLVRQTWSAVGRRIAERQLNQGAASAALYELAVQIGVTLIRGRTLAAIPVVGAAIGGSTNGLYMKRVGWAARRTFQERWLEDSGRLTSAPDTKL